jgi:hypothetical protein
VTSAVHRVAEVGGGVRPVTLEARHLKLLDRIAQPGPKAMSADVDEDPPEPRLEPVCIAQPPTCPPGREGGIGDGVLGLHSAPEDHGREPAGPIELRLDERADWPRINRHAVASERDRLGSIPSIHPRLHLTTG